MSLTTAARPRNSVLDCRTLNSVLGMQTTNLDTSGLFALHMLINEYYVFSFFQALSQSSSKFVEYAEYYESSTKNIHMKSLTSVIMF